MKAKRTKRRPQKIGELPDTFDKANKNRLLWTNTSNKTVKIVININVRSKPHI